MSWFSFGLKFADSWQSHSKVEDLLTGQFAIDYIFKTQVAPHPAYLNIKQKAADSFAEHAKNHFKPSSRGIATGILKRHLTSDALSTVARRITSEVKNILALSLKRKLGFSAYLPTIGEQAPATSAPSSTPIIQTSNPSSKTIIDGPIPPSSSVPSSRLQSLRNYLNTNYDAKDTEELKALLAKWQIQDFILLSTQLSLRPICEKAVLEAIGSASKTGTGFGIDLVLKKTLTMTALPLLSCLVSTAATWTSYFLQDQLNQSSYTAQGIQAIGYLPSTATILTFSTAYHLGQIAYIWHSTYNTPNTSREDKKRVRELAIQLVEKRLADKIQNNPVTKKLGLNLSRETVDKIAISLINETIDNYWQTLSETHLLGMPIVYESERGLSHSAANAATAYSHG